MGTSYGKASMPNKDFDNAGDVLGGISDALNNENAWDSGVDTMDFFDDFFRERKDLFPPSIPGGCGCGSGSIIEEKDVVL